MQQLFLRDETDFYRSSLRAIFAFWFILSKGSGRKPYFQRCYRFQKEVFRRLSAEKRILG